MTRDQVLGAVRKTHADFLAALAGVPENAMAEQVVIADWTLKDMLGHIAAWYQVATHFLRDYQREGVPQALGLSDDAALNAFNARAAETRRSWSPVQVRAEFDAAFAELTVEIERLSDAQLNAQLPAPWEQGVTLERLIAWNSYEHVPEHTEQIVKWSGSRIVK
jgi:hypothetical protein